MMEAADAAVPVASTTAGVSSADEMAHTFRPTIFSREHRFVLERDALRWSGGRTEQRAPLSDIVRIRLYAVPAGIGPQLRRAVLSVRSGRKLLLQGSSYVRVGVIEDRGESYRLLLEELVKRVAVANPKVELLVGPSTALWAFWLCVLIASGIALAFGLLLVTQGNFPLSAALYFGLVLLYVPLCWRFVAAGRARRADPMRLPRTLFAAR